MSEAYIDGGSIPFPGYINAAPTFNPLFLVEPPGPLGVGIYVSATGGSDSNPGTILEPFATLTRALSQRTTLSNALYVTIYLLPGNYTQAGTYTIPSNTALVGVQAGGLTDYLNASELSLGGSPVTLTGYSLALGSALPATGARVLLSGLNVLGAITASASECSYFLYSCNVQNNLGIGIVAGTALNAQPGTRVFAEGCSFTNNMIANPVIFIQGEEFTLLNSTAKMTNVTPGAGTSAPVIAHSRAPANLGVQYLTIRDCEISTANGNTATQTIAPLLRFPLAGSFSGRTIVDLTYSILRYDSPDSVSNPPDKCCIRVDANRTIDMTAVNLMLLQPGGAGTSIQSTGGNTTLVFANNLGINGRNGRGVQTSTRLENMP